MTLKAGADLERFLQRADILYHLAGVNRPADPAEFERGNVGLTADIVSLLDKLGRHPTIVFSSSIQQPSITSTESARRERRKSLRLMLNAPVQGLRVPTAERVREMEQAELQFRRFHLLL